MLSKYILGILCLTSLMKWHFVDSQKQGQRCPFSRDRPRGQPFPDQYLGDKCTLPTPRCNRNDVFYSIDGSCNNINNPNWGRAGSTFVRLLPANYSDGFSQLRTSVIGNPLPLPRTLSVNLFQDLNVPSNRLNIWFYGFGQFVDHDVTLSNEIPIDGSQCCVNNQLVRRPSDDCLPIIIPPNDRFYRQFRATCIPIKRIRHTRHEECDVRPLFQINSQTAFLDLSILYGKDKYRVDKQRMGEGGKLRIQNNLRTGNQDFPPILPPNQCIIRLGGVNRGQNEECFMSADGRINQNPEILLVDTVFLRLHNKIAESLQSINPRWNDDKLFQEARRIAIAIYQHVVYAEYLPVLLGTEVASRFRLLPASNGYVNGYDPNLNPQTMSSYTAAAARAGHSNIVGSFRYNSNRRPQSYLLRDVLFKNDFLLRRNVFNNILQEYLGQTCNQQDQFTTGEVNNWMFFSEREPFGFDLTAVDILRGRDFGLQPYNKYREVCGFRPLNNFRDLERDIMRPQDVGILSQLYTSVDDIDYFIGGQLEIPLPNAALGPSFACVQAESYHRWKFGDRLYYEFPTAGFTPAQLRSIRRITMSQIICATNPSIRQIQRNSFLVRSSRNPQVLCNQIPKMDLRPWTETNGGRNGGNRGQGSGGGSSGIFGRRRNRNSKI